MNCVKPLDENFQVEGHTLSIIRYATHKVHKVYYISELVLNSFVYIFILESMNHWPNRKGRNPEVQTKKWLVKFKIYLC